MKRRLPDRGFASWWAVLTLRRWAAKLLVWILVSRKDWTALIHQWAFSEERGSVVDPRITVGRHTYGVQRNTVFLALESDRIEIGSFCSIAQDVRFVFGEHRLDTVSTYPLRTILSENWLTNRDAFAKGKIVVGNDVWIGTNALVLSGVTVGHGAVIAAGAVVTKDVPPYAVAAGVPARVIKKRLPDEQIAALLQIRWWEWPDEKVMAHLDLFYGDPGAFIRRFAPAVTA